MTQEAKHEILSEVSNPSISNNSISSLNETHLASNYEANTSLADFAQQTLMDVNSQPLIQNIMENHQLISHPLNDATSNPVILTSDEQLMAIETTASNETSTSTTAAVATATADTNTMDVHMLDPNSPIITEFYEKFPMGRMFESLEELRTETYEYGRKHNVALTTSKSDKTKIYLICKHGGQYRKNTKKAQTNRVIKPRVRRSQKTGCACMIYARCCRGSFWIIRKSVGEHNHPIAEDPRTYAMYRSLTPENLLLVHRLLREHVGVSLIVKSLKANGITNILAKDIENIQQDLKRRDVLELAASSGHSSSLLTDGSVADTPTNVVTPIPTTHILDYQDPTHSATLITSSTHSVTTETSYETSTESHIVHELTGAIVASSE